MQARALQLYYKREPWHRCFPVNFAIFTPFLTEHLWWLLLVVIYFVIANTYSCWFFAKLSWEKIIFRKNISVFTKIYSFLQKKNVFVWKKSFIMKKFFIEKNFFYREKLYLISEIYFYTENICVINKIWIFLKYIFISAKKKILIIKIAFVKTLLWTQ